jgi:hypothetical protein
MILPALLPPPCPQGPSLRALCPYEKRPPGHFVGHRSENLEVCVWGKMVRRGSAFGLCDLEKACVCVCARAHVSVCERAHVSRTCMRYLCARMHACMHASNQERKRESERVWVCIFACECMCICAHACVGLPIYFLLLHGYVYASMHIHVWGCLPSS